MHDAKRRSLLRAPNERRRLVVGRLEVPKIGEPEPDLRREKRYVVGLSARHCSTRHTIPRRRQAFGNAPPASGRVCALGHEMDVMAATRELLDDRLQVAEVAEVKRSEDDLHRRWSPPPRRPIRCVNTRKSCTPTFTIRRIRPR